MAVTNIDDKQTHEYPSGERLASLWPGDCTHQHIFLCAINSSICFQTTRLLTRNILVWDLESFEVVDCYRGHTDVMWEVQKCLARAKKFQLLW